MLAIRISSIAWRKEGLIVIWPKGENRRGAGIVILEERRDVGVLKGPVIVVNWYKMHSDEHLLMTHAQRHTHHAQP